MARTTGSRLADRGKICAKDAYPTPDAAPLISGKTRTPPLAQVLVRGPEDTPAEMEGQGTTPPRPRGIQEPAAASGQGRLR